MPAITFFLRSNNDRAGSQVLYVRVTFNHSTSERSLGEKITPGEWNQVAQSFTSPNKKRHGYINLLLDTVRYKLKTAALTARTGAKAKELIESLQPKPALASTVIFVSDCVRRYINSQKGIRAPGTIKNHEIKLKNLEQYEEYRSCRFVPNSSIPGTTFDLPESERFLEWYSREKRTNNVATASRNVELYLKAMKWAAKKGEFKEIDLLLYQASRDRVKPAVFLSPGELRRLIEYQFTSTLLIKVKDLYLFQISTGVSFGNIWQGWEIRGSEGGRLLSGVRSKRNQYDAQAFFVPLNEIAASILEKYNSQLPKIENAVYNRILKEIAAILGIDKKLTTHTGRKTFATLMDGDGWSRETISKMLGHKSVTTTETYYLGESSQRVEMEMAVRTGNKFFRNVQPD